MKYEELKNRQAKDYNELPLFFAFSNNQFNEEMLRLGLTPEDKDKIVSLGAGTFIKKTDRHLVKDLFKKHTEELAEAREDVQYLYDMFLYELGNHEYCITYDATDTLRALSLTIEDVNNDERMKKALIKATTDYLKFYE